ncbi:hypothetical protein [Streptomyces sp. CC219B]|uniref:hypothetical protein n=1 Tax=Streptomyces sp. CC219B TaxID=3044574 RepID=UPI0024A90702|nr:hypothetical protein [Streptomyces sp. CC219B]
MSRAPHSSRAAGSDAPEDDEDEDDDEDDEEDEWGGWGWLSGIALQVLGARAARGDKITQSESSLGR